MERVKKITREIEEIQTLLTAIQEDVKGIKDLHVGFIPVMVELELLSANLQDIKNELI
jgi:hypothetical protein